MKTIKYILILFCATVGLFAQDREPQPMEFIWGTKDYPRVFDPKNSQFQQKEFLIGTQWGHTPQYYVGMNHNAAAGRFLIHKLDSMYIKPITTIYQPTLDWWFIAFRISPAMHYDPTLSESDMNTPNFYPDDPTTSVFGFLHQDKVFTYLDTNSNNRRLGIKYIFDSVYKAEGYNVLSNISEQPNFKTEFCIPSQNEGLFGHRWFLSVNMRKLSKNTNIDSTKLITIKIKYYIKDTSGVTHTRYINFDSIPERHYKMYEVLPFNRGKQQLKQKIESGTKHLVIYSDMYERIEEDKTFTASFLTLRPSQGNEYYNKPYLINPEFPPGHRFGKDYSDTLKVLDAENLLNPINYANVWQKPMPCIDSLDIEVYYHNAEDIAIDYIKIESENAYYMSRGFIDTVRTNDTLVENRYVRVIGNYNYKDSLTLHNRNNMPYNIWARPYSIKHTMQGWLNNEENSATIYGTNTKLRQALRFYIQDTESEKPHFWWQLRYANLITNGLSVTRDLPYKHKLYRYYTKSKNKYLGIKIQENENMVPSPAIQFGNGGVHSNGYYMNLKYGYSIDRGNEDQAQWGITATEQDPLISANRKLFSNYETYLNLNVGGLPDVLDTAFKDINNRYSLGYRLFDIARNVNLNNPNEKKLFDEIVKQSGSIQIRWENSLRDKLYNHQDMLYSDDGWWMNYFLGTDYHQADVLCIDTGWSTSGPYLMLDTTTIPQFSGWRYKTGEETRLLLYGSILKGAKGFFYDRECDFPYLISPGKYTDILGIGFGDNIDTADWNVNEHSLYPLNDAIPFNQYKAVANEHVGNDFLNPENDPSMIHFCINRVVSFIASSLGVAQDRIYLGMRSTRTEVYKISQIIRRLEQNKRNYPRNSPHDLMDLRLIAWYGKGFTEMYSEYPGESNGVFMDYFLDKSSIRTAKLYQPNTNCYFQNVTGNDTLSVNYWESIDSSFFDITVLAPKDIMNSNINKLYYIGIQNRRTDPLVWDVATQKMKFYSTAEFEDSCISNNRNTQDYFKDIFWKRLGCRLISFKINPGDVTINNNSYCSLQINEILAQDTKFNDTNSSWRADNYCHKINYYIPWRDTVYAPEIRIKLLPGEGKLLRVKSYQIVIFPSPKASCPSVSDLYLNYKLVKDEGDSLEYDLFVVNNTQNDLKDLPILYRFLREDVNINLNEFVNHSNLHPDCYDEYKLKRVSIIDSLFSQSQSQIAKIKVDKKAGLPELVYRFDVLSKDDKPCDQVFINSDNHIKEYYGKGYKGKKSHKYQPDFVSSLEVNPNPANDKLIVSFASSEVSTYKIRIYDINGSMVYSQNNSISNIGTNELTLDISILPVGLYNLSLEINNNKISKKFSIDR